MLYGVTTVGGVSNSGTAFALVPNGNGFDFQLLYRFCRKAGCPDGSRPNSPLALDVNGNLYGMTQFGGAGNRGVIFKLAPNADRTNWSDRTLYVFCPSGSDCTDGSTPQGALAYRGAQTGALYDGTSPLFGTAAFGGGGNGGTGAGVLFRLAPVNGKLRYKVLYNFCSQSNCPDGSDPLGLTIDANNNLYGLTAGGGETNHGAAFEFSPAKGIETVLYSFCIFAGPPACADGSLPSPALSWDAQGRLYGTTDAGGGANLGVLFRITPRGTRSFEEVLYSFCAFPNCTDGEEPRSGVTVDAKGNVFGTTSLGNKYPGTNCFAFQVGCGTLFRFSGGKYKVLHNFCEAGLVSCPDGGDPNTEPLSIDSAGRVFGETLGGGLHNAGVIYEYLP